MKLRWREYYGNVKDTFSLPGCAFAQLCSFCCVSVWPDPCCFHYPFYSL